MLPIFTFSPLMEEFIWLNKCRKILIHRGPPWYESSSREVIQIQTLDKREGACLSSPLHQCIPFQFNELKWNSGPLYPFFTSTHAMTYCLLITPLYLETTMIPFFVFKHIYHTVLSPPPIACNNYDSKIRGRVSS